MRSSDETNAGFFIILAIFVCVCIYLIHISNNRNEQRDIDTYRCMDKYVGSSSSAKETHEALRLCEDYTFLNKQTVGDK